MDYTFAGYGNGGYAGYYGQPLNHGLQVYPTLPYLYHPAFQQHYRDQMMPEKQPESKPRLSKEEVEILEAHFRQNPKPPSSVKRELAERMHVELPRINNWFQNRRAKAKQERNQEEYKARQAAAAAAMEEDPAEDGSTVQEHFPLSNQQAPLQPCVTSFTDSTASEPLTVTQRDSPTGADDPPPQMENQIPGSSDNEYSESSSVPAFASSVDAYVAPRPIEPVSPDQDYISMSHDEFQPYDGGLDAPKPSESTLVPTSGVLGLDTQSFLSQTASDECSAGVDAQDFHLPESCVKPEPSPPAPTGFKSPPPAADLARRRNRRPLGLSTFPHHHGQPALRTATGDLPRRSDTTSPIRRIASATGWAPPRIVKNNSGSAPRSPMYPGHKRETLLQTLHGARSPILGLSVNAAVAGGPPTPRTPLCPGQQSSRENTVSSVSSEDEQYGYAYQNSISPFMKIDDPSLKTPPGTPGVPGGYGYAANPIEAAYNFAPQEDALFTPGIHGQMGFPTDLEIEAPLQAPGYIETTPVSQPPTPSFPSQSMGSGYYPGFGGGPGTEYNWPDALPYASSARSSPGGSKSKTFQFTPNMTPQHFHAEK